MKKLILILSLLASTSLFAGNVGGGAAYNNGQTSDNALTTIFEMASAGNVGGGKVDPSILDSDIFQGNVGGGGAPAKGNVGGGGRF